MRLQKYMAQCGVASRRAAEEIIKEGRVKINGNIITQMGVLVEPDDFVTLDDKPIKIEPEKHYIMYHKPMGEITSVKDEAGRPTVLDKFRDYPVRIYPVGRLDFNSEGLLLLTNDGELASKMLHPSRKMDKVYLARVSYKVEEADAKKLEKGVYIDGYKTAPARVKILNANNLFTDIMITIHEGKNRQVRKMVESIGHQVVLLRRVRFGSLELGDLPRGMWRRLSDVELKKLKKLLL
ncbi:MAG: rRNA pseudouridine synthase [Christensenellaceae bacterium]|nr:rRNA pseudouridine synthase [Christensenellaceae bacterium]